MKVLHSLETTESGGVEQNMMPMVDIIFLVIIFCMIAMTKMVQLEISEIEVPTVQKSTKVSEDTFFTITLKKNGRVMLDKGGSTQSMTALELCGALQQVGAVTSSSTLLVLGDKAATYEQMVGLLKTLRVAGYGKVFCLTPEEKG